CICPGGIVTPLLMRGFGDTPQAIEMMKGFLAHAQPVQRPGMPEDIAAAALYLASDAGSFVNGHALVVDGGLTGGRLWSQTKAAMRQKPARVGLCRAPPTP